MKRFIVDLIVIAVIVGGHLAYAHVSEGQIHDLEQKGFRCQVDLEHAVNRPRVQP